MTKNKTLIVLIIVIVISVTVSFQLYRKVDYLNNRLETLGNNVIYYCDSIDQVQFQIHEFKEQSYIRQQEHDTNLILATFTLLLGAFVGLNIIVSETRFTRFKKYITDEASKQASKWQEKHEKLSENLEELQADVKSEVAWLKKEDAKESIGLNDLPKFIYYNFRACQYFADCALYYHFKYPESSLDSSYLENILTTLKQTKQTIGIYSKDKKVIMIDHEPDNFLSIFSRLRELNNYDLDKLIADIQQLIEFPSDKQ